MEEKNYFLQKNRLPCRILTLLCTSRCQKLIRNLVEGMNIQNLRFFPTPWFSDSVVHNWPIFKIIQSFILLSTYFFLQLLSFLNQKDLVKNIDENWCNYAILIYRIYIYLHIDISKLGHISICIVHIFMYSYIWNHFLNSKTSVIILIF